MTLAQHVVSRLVDNRVIAPSPLERRCLARVVLKLTLQYGLLAFGLADTHLHLLLACAREAAGRIARSLENSLAKRLALEVPFAPAYFKPVEDNSHLYRAFIYVIEQATHHGLDWDPLHEASNLPDLIGLRLLGAHSLANVRQRLPRVRRADLLRCMGLEDLRAADGPPEHAVRAVLAATGLSDLRGGSLEVTAARLSLVSLVGRRLSTLDLARQFGLSARRVQQLRHRPADPQLLQAVRLQLGLIQQRAEALRRLDLPFVRPVDGEAAGPTVIATTAPPARSTSTRVGIAPPPVRAA